MIIMVSYNLGNVKGPAGKGITSITKTGTVGLVDTYQILYSDGTTSTFTVTNGESGADIVTSWESTPSDSKVASEKLTKDTLDTKASNSHTHGNISNDGKIGSSSGKIIVTGTSGLLGASDLKTINNNSLLGSGNIDIQGGGGSVDIDTSFPSTPSDTHVPSTKLVKNSLDAKLTGTKVTSWSSTVSNSNVPSEKLVKDTIDGLSIPTKISDLTNDSDFIETSSTSGLIKNDGSVMTSGTGSSNWAVGNHTHSGYVSATKVTSWSSTTSDSNVPSEKLVKDTIDDLIGEAIQYIQQ